MHDSLPYSWCKSGRDSKSQKDSSASSTMQDCSHCASAAADLRCLNVAHRDRSCAGALAFSELICQERSRKSYSALLHNDLPCSQSTFLLDTGARLAVSLALHQARTSAAADSRCLTRVRTEAGHVLDGRSPSVSSSSAYARAAASLLARSSSTAPEAFHPLSYLSRNQMGLYACAQHDA